jgi:hypothetical protein
MHVRSGEMIGQYDELVNFDDHVRLHPVLNSSAGVRRLTPALFLPE